MYCNTIIKTALLYGVGIWTSTSYQNLNIIFRLQQKSCKDHLGRGTTLTLTLTAFVPGTSNWLLVYIKTHTSTDAQ